MIYLITPTGARPQQIRHCANWMKNQTYKGEVTWIIVDDGNPVTTDFIKQDFKENWTIIKNYPKPVWTPGVNTQARNLSAGLSKVKNEKDNIIFIIEDDDYYKPVYIERMVERMGNHMVIGETNTIYYNVVTRRFADNGNKSHASLFQLAFKANMIPAFINCLNNRFIDFVFCNSVKNQILLFHSGTLAIGIKGISGRGGIGAGHSLNFTAIYDKDMAFLKSMIGEDAGAYAKYYNEKAYAQPVQHVNIRGRRHIQLDGTLFKARRKY